MAKRVPQRTACLSSFNQTRSRTRHLHTWPPLLHQLAILCLEVADLLLLKSCDLTGFIVCTDTSELNAQNDLNLGIIGNCAISALIDSKVLNFYVSRYLSLILCFFYFAGMYQLGLLSPFWWRSNLLQSSSKNEGYWLLWYRHGKLCEHFSRMYEDFFVCLCDWLIINF